LSEPAVIDAQLHAHDHQQVAAHLAAMTVAGVDAAVLVQTVSQGYDNTFLLGAAAAEPGRFSVVGVVDPVVPGIEEDVTAWRRTRYALGLRVVALSDERVARLRAGGYERLLSAAERCSVPMFVYAPRNLDVLEAIAEAHPALLLVLDHIGLPQPPVLRDGEDAWSDFDRVLGLARLPNVALKISALPTVSREQSPFNDLWPRLHRLLDAYGAGRLMWGSDITRETIRHDYIEALDYIRTTDEIGAGEKGELLGGSMRRLCNWDDVVSRVPVEAVA
jgi:L-fuconolactonase